jgi:hypothetical protein
MNENERHKEGKCFECGTTDKTERKEEKWRKRRKTAAFW